MAKGTLNKVMLIGRLGADPDIRYSAGGTAVAKFNLATDDRAPSGDGNWEDKTEWHRIVVFGKTAEFCGNYLSKGRLVYVEGSLRTNQWEDAQGVKRYTTEIIARDIQLVGAKGDDAGSGGYAKGGQGQSRGGDYSGGRTSEELPPASSKSSEDDIPF